MTAGLHPDAPSRDHHRIERRLRTADSCLPPSVVVVHPTDRCNHRCDWCWFDRSRAEISPQWIDRIIDNSVIRPESVEEVVVAGGGEPLLYEEINRLLSMVSSRCPAAFLKLDTNGSLLKRLDTGVLRQIGYLRVSLDATSPEEYAITRHVKSDEWSRVVTNIEWARRTAPDIQLGVSLVEHRLRGEDELESLSEMLTGMGVDWVFRKPLLGRDLSQATLSEQGSASPAHLARAGGPINPHIAAPPLAIASMLALVGADSGVYTCYHKQGHSDALLTSLNDSAPIDGGHTRLAWSMHAARPHPCRVYSAWQEFLTGATAGDP